MDRATCDQEIRDAFYEQDQAVVVLRPKDGGSLWRSEVLSALDEVCTAFEDAQTGWDIAVKCITSVSLMEARKGAPPQMVILRDELPLKSEAERARVEALGTSLEFAIRDTIDAEGTRAYVHLPYASFEDVDIAALVAEQLAGQDVLDGALDLPGSEPSPEYESLAGDGPSGRSFVGLYDAGTDGAIKDPEHLQVLDAFQERAEGLKHVAQSFTIVDDLKVTRQGLRGGKDEAFAVPTSRAEAAQLLLALSMSPATKLGPRLDGRERVGLIRVNLSPTSDDQARRTLRKLETFLAQETPDGARAFFCATALPAETAEAAD